MITALMVAFALEQMTDDRDVLQTAMFSFFKPEPWYSSDWKPKHRIFIGTKFRSEEVTYESLLTEATRNVQEESEDHVQHPFEKDPFGRREVVKESLRELQTARQLANVSRTYQPFPMRSISGSWWDQRIMVTDSSARLSRLTEKKPVDPRLEKRGVYVYPCRPTYSPDGSRCMLKLTVPWSMHSADVIFLLERQTTGTSETSWKIKASTAMFYV